ncbi:hypothetical protein B7P43_G13883 [Cryptotermes secundus]|uniref:Uncharacterized protein n=1 Tax=Cryptotermes secundus TaxID=105785 RepID=A0A2J7Q9E5_9NEOP|nr:hypothetical protein B7P43_G13883 [Cryptotermes secundus]
MIQIMTKYMTRTPDRLLFSRFIRMEADIFCEALEIDYTLTWGLSKEVFL